MLLPQQFFTAHIGPSRAGRLDYFQGVTVRDKVGCGSFDAGGASEAHRPILSSRRLKQESAGLFSLRPIRRV
jgi:hypothetical protein